MQWFISHRH